MGNRILKESICTSETIDSLSSMEETAFYRLLVNCDDYGRMDGRASVLKSRLFPLKTIRLDQVDDIINKLASVGLVSRYIVDGKPFVQTVKWDCHQIIRAKKSKYPSPADGMRQMQAHECTCNQMISDDSKCCRNPIQSESESKSNLNPNAYANLLSESEMDTASKTYREGMTAIESLSRASGMGWEQTDWMEAERLMSEYGVEWITEAITRTSKQAKDKRSWSYIEGILKNWRTKGGIDNGVRANRPSNNGYSGHNPAETPGSIQPSLQDVKRY